MRTSLSLRRPQAALWLTVGAVLCALAGSAHAQESNDERWCTGQWRATLDQRIASCSI